MATLSHNTPENFVYLKLGVYLRKFKQIGRTSRRCFTSSKPSSSTTGFLLSLPPNQLGGLFLLNDNVSSRNLVLLPWSPYHRRLEHFLPCSDRVLSPAVQIKDDATLYVGPPSDSCEVARVCQDMLKVNELPYSNLFFLHLQCNRASGSSFLQPKVDHLLISRAS